VKSNALFFTQDGKDIYSLEIENHDVLSAIKVVNDETLINRIRR
jgi:hypothetical protein